MRNHLSGPIATAVALVAVLGVCLASSSDAKSGQSELAKNGNFKAHGADPHQPAAYLLSGSVEYRYLGDPARDVAGWGVALKSSGRQGAVTQSVGEIDTKEGRWFRFSFRGLPQDNFAVTDNDLFMKVEYFGDAGRTSFDGKVKKIYPLVEQDRHDLNVNGDHRVGGAAVWRTYNLDFWLPFPQVDQVRLSVGFDQGAPRTTTASDFLVTDFSLVRIDGTDPAAGTSTAPTDAQQKPQGVLLPIGGRWFYIARPGETTIPALFDADNADQLIYHDDKWGTPFAGEMSAWLRAGDKDIDGNVATQDRFIPDNVTIRFDKSAMIVSTKGLPNHETGKFPEAGSGLGGPGLGGGPGRRPAPGGGPGGGGGGGGGGGANPNYIQEQRNVYYIPINPQVNARHIATATDNSNHALPMGPIGLAMNGVVFFNPFDAGNMDASNIMDRCCGHPNQDNFYHYHKYPICMYSPWRDEGNGHSPVIGWAFDGFPVYGPYESANVMAKEVKGDGTLNEFNLHWDEERGWHYHVTPGKFPYILGGYWGTEDPRDSQRPRHPRGSEGPDGPPNGPPNGPPGGFPPPEGRGGGFDGPPG